MNNEIKKLWAAKTFELMNIGAGVLVFGQAFAGKQFSIPITAVGLLLVAIGYILSYILLRNRR